MYAERVCADLSRCLAGAFLADGDWDQPALDARGRALFERRPPWLHTLVAATLATYPRRPADRPRELSRHLARQLAQPPPDEEQPDPPRIRRWPALEPVMGFRRWPVAELDTLADLATMLQITDGELAWFTDLRGWERTTTETRLRNYTYATIARPARPGRTARPPRVIERPKHRLKSIQRRILHEILDWIPQHDAAHGFTKSRSVKTHAVLHCGQAVVIRLDLEDFFDSIEASRIYGILRTAGYPEQVAHTLTGLTTNVVPARIWEAIPRPDHPRQIEAHARLGRRLATPHLPQGAPTSPALANLAAFRLDRRLTGLARCLDLTYSRYADDLVFSGPRNTPQLAQTLRNAVTDIARDEHFTVNADKSTLTTRAGRQQTCGVVVNAHPNIARREYDALKAILHNCIRTGPSSQNHAQAADFRAHLLGRIAWVTTLNPTRGEKLRRQFAQISWGDGAPS